MTPLSPAMLERMASQARAVERAAATHRNLMALEPRYGRPSGISLDGGRTVLPITYGEPPAAFAPHPAFDPANSIGARR